MKAIVQRVLSASVTVDSQIVSEIPQGLLILAAISPHDTSTQVQTMAHRLLNLKLFDEPLCSSSDTATPNTPKITAPNNTTPNNAETNRAFAPTRWRHSCLSLRLPLLIVSQFTLYAHTAKGHKPSFHNACPPEKAKLLYDELVDALRVQYGRELMGGKEAGRKRTVGKEGLREWEKEEVRREEVERGRWRERGAEMVREGVFGAMMQVALVNDGPVTVEVVVEAPAGVEKGEKKGGKGEKKEGSKEGKKGKKEKARRWREENMKSGEKASDTNGEEEVREVLSGEEEEAENPIRIGLAGGRE